MGKGINMNAMDKLFSGLSGNEENMSIEHEQANEEAILLSLQSNHKKAKVTDISQSSNISAQ